MVKYIKWLKESLTTWWSMAAINLKWQKTELEKGESDMHNCRSMGEADLSAMCLAPFHCNQSQKAKKEY